MDMLVLRASSAEQCSARNILCVYHLADTKRSLAARYLTHAVNVLLDDHTYQNLMDLSKNSDHFVIFNLRSISGVP